MASTSIPAPRAAVRRTPKRLLALRGDTHLVARVRAEDEAAFEVLYERHAPGILSFCRHMLSDAEEAEDAVQQVFLSAHRDLLRDERQINVKPWLYTIARNRCLSILRMRRDRPDSELDPVTAGLGEEVQRRADLRELVADLRDLPEDQRAALVLTEIGDLSHAEVAGVLECGTANVKGLVFRARAGLIERRDAREVPCEEIREELASARHGALRRGRLRHHLAACPGCKLYLDEVRRQRRMMALVLPVVPSVGLKRSVLAAAGLGGGGGAAAGGGALSAGGLSAGGLSTLLPASSAVVAKVAVAAVLAGSVGVAGKAAIDHDQAPVPAPATVTPREAGAPDRVRGDAPNSAPGVTDRRAPGHAEAAGGARARSNGNRANHERGKPSRDNVRSRSDASRRRGRVDKPGSHPERAFRTPQAKPRGRGRGPAVDPAPKPPAATGGRPVRQTDKPAKTKQNQSLPDDALAP